MCVACAAGAVFRRTIVGFWCSTAGLQAAAATPDPPMHGWGPFGAALAVGMATMATTLVVVGLNGFNTEHMTERGVKKHPKTAKFWVTVAVGSLLTVLGQAVCGELSNAALVLAAGRFAAM